MTLSVWAENITNQSIGPAVAYIFGVTSHYSRCVLPPVLQHKKSVVQGRGHLGLGVANNSDDPAQRLPNVALGLGT